MEKELIPKTMREQSGGGGIHGGKKTFEDFLRKGWQKKKDTANELTKTARDSHSQDEEKKKKFDWSDHFKVYGVFREQLNGRICLHKADVNCG